MKRDELVTALEAVLFASGEPLSIERISQILEIKPENVEKITLELAKKLDDNKSGVALIRLENTYQLASRKEYGAYIKRAFDIKRKTPLSPAAFEVLAVVAYNQPVTKSFIEQVRGVDCSGVVSTLVEKELIEERGRLELPGRPLLYGTTKNFLRCFGISDLGELPELPKAQSDIRDIGEQLELTETEIPTAEEEEN